jgi:bacillopeptidase F (M6 metalloprotease family)
MARWRHGAVELHSSATVQHNKLGARKDRRAETQRKRKEETTQAVARHKNLRAAIYHHQPVADWFRAVRASHACWAIREDTIADY